MPDQLNKAQKQIVTQHKWQRVGHPYNRESVCIKCGCRKDTSNMNFIEYYINGASFFNAPNCSPTSAKQ